MTNKIMFFVGLVVFVVYAFFLLRIISRQHRIQRREHAEAYDSIDQDGMGNQGRIPNKKTKNRA
jgi:preprotein translocase subunit YajC